jgi:hypothetical protein
MNMLKNLQKFIKVHHVLAFLGLLLLFVYVARYSNRKGSVFDGLSSQNSSKMKTSNQDASNVSESSSGSVMPAQPAGQNEVYASVSGIAGSQNIAPNCSRKPIVNPDDLLPKDENSQWAQLNPRGNGELNNVNLLQAGYLNGINTVGSSLRNANLQLRSEPPNPQSQVSPWLNSTIEPDLMRLPLEIGCGRQ